MGWTHCFDGRLKPNGSVDRRYECDRLCNWKEVDSNGKVISRGELLKSAMVGSTYYAAVRNKDGKVWAAIIQTCGRTKWDGTIWGYKNMDETMGPCEDKCPASILALLSPTDNATANEWSERCRLNIAKAAEIRRNGHKPLFTPVGVTVTVEGKSWIMTSSAYKEKTMYRYRGVRFSKARWHDYDHAMCAFLREYGTKEQKKEWAEAGRPCPNDWKGAAA